MHTGRLLLAPQDPFLAPPPVRLVEGLAAAGLLGAPLPGRAGAYLAGERFLELIVFAGCSVQVELSPPADGSDAFSHVRIEGPYRTPVLACGRNTRPPRCPACRTPLRQWRERAGEWGPAGATASLHCPSCGADHPPWAWDWKGHAGFGRLLVRIEEVFPGEATPAPGLKAILAELAGAPWRHFFVQE